MRNKYMNSNHSIEYEKFKYFRKNAERNNIIYNKNNNSKPITRNKIENRDMT